MPMAKVLSTAEILCYINGRLYGQVSSFGFRSITQRRAIHGIDVLDPQELAPGPTKISGSLHVYRTIGDGGAEGAGMTTDFGDLPAEQYFSIVLIDRALGTTVFRADNCSVMSQTWDIPKKGIVTGSIEFDALTWSNETLNP